MKKVFWCALPLLLLAGCDLLSTGAADQSTPLVCMQITETQDPDALEKLISELRARGLKAAVLVDADFAARNCQALTALRNEGFEIMAFARPDEAGGEDLTLSMLSYEQQQDLITGVKTAIEECLGETIVGFRCYRFDQDDSTCGILDALGFEFNLGFVARTDASLPGHRDDTLPYPAPGYGFWAVPMHSVYAGGRWTAFCDMPFQSLDAAQWEALLQSELDDMSSRGRPLLVEFHPYYTAVDEGRFQAFVSFLDYAVGKNARFMTVAELVQWSQQQGSTGSCPVCTE